MPAHHPFLGSCRASPPQALMGHRGLSALCSVPRPTHSHLRGEGTSRRQRERARQRMLGVPWQTSQFCPRPSRIPSTARDKLKLRTGDYWVSWEAALNTATCAKTVCPGVNGLRALVSDRNCGGKRPPLAFLRFSVFSERYCWARTSETLGPSLQVPLC